MLPLGIRQLSMMRNAGCSILISLLLAFHHSVTLANDSCWAYDTEIRGVTGTMEIRVFYGAPGYGEDPIKDKRDVQALLFLDFPACAKGASLPSENNQVEVTLVPLSSQPLSAFVGKRVKVTGKLLNAHTGHHHTPLLLLLTEAALEIH